MVQYYYWGGAAGGGGGAVRRGVWYMQLIVVPCLCLWMRRKW
jgi:hypothetical protein